LGSFQIVRLGDNKALTKQINQPSAVETNYHRIMAVYGLRSTGEAELYIGEYTTAEARFAGAEPVAHTRHNVTLSAETVDQVMALIYADPAMQTGRYEGSEARDPDPEKEEEMN
jgi:hypothetical protein